MAIKKTTKKVASTYAKVPAGKPTEMPCKCGTGCGCRGGFWKKLIILLIVFAAGFAVCHFGCCKKGWHGKRMHFAEKFVDGCLDLSKIKCPQKAEKMAMADLDGDGCITKEEMKTFWKEKRADVAEQTEE